MWGAGRMPEGDDYATELRGDRGRSMVKRRDPWAIAVAALSILTQLGMWIWWGGRLDQRVMTLEQAHLRNQQRDEAKSVIDGLQTTQIAVITAQLDGIKQSVDRIDRKIPERTR